GRRRARRAGRGVGRQRGSGAPIHTHPRASAHISRANSAPATPKRAPLHTREAPVRNQPPMLGMAAGAGFFTPFASSSLETSRPCGYEPSAAPTLVILLPSKPPGWLGRGK